MLAVERGGRVLPANCHSTDYVRVPGKLSFAIAIAVVLALFHASRSDLSPGSIVANPTTRCPSEDYARIDQVPRLALSISTWLSLRKTKHQGHPEKADEAVLVDSGAQASCVLTVEVTRLPKVDIFISLTPAAFVCLIPWNDPRMDLARREAVDELLRAPRVCFGPSSYDIQT